MDLNQLKKQLQFKLGAVDPNLIALIPGFINTACSNWNNIDWKFAEFIDETITLSNGIENYIIPGNMRKIKGVRIKGKTNKLVYKDSNWVDLYFPKHGDTGEPNYYNTLGVDLFVYPIPTIVQEGFVLTISGWRYLNPEDYPEYFSNTALYAVLRTVLKSGTPEQLEAKEQFRVGFVELVSRYKSSEEEHGVKILDPVVENQNTIRRQLRVRPR